MFLNPVHGFVLHFECGEIWTEDDIECCGMLISYVQIQRFWQSEAFFTQDTFGHDFSADMIKKTFVNDIRCVNFDILEIA